MNYKIYFLGFLFILCFSSCKKNYTCTCTNASGTYDAGEVEATKSKAKQKCKDLSSGSTNCELK